MLSGLRIVDNLTLASTFNGETNILHFETFVINEKVKGKRNKPENFPLQQQ